MSAQILVSVNDNLARICELTGYTVDMETQTILRSKQGVRSFIVDHPNINQQMLNDAMTAYGLEKDQEIPDRFALDAIDKIELWAGAARMKYVTGSPGQAEVYVFKQQQAQAYIDAGKTGTVPALVQSEANASGMTAGDAADYIIAQADAWLAIAASIDEARRSGKIAIEAARVAKDEAAIISARDAAIAAIQAI